MRRAAIRARQRREPRRPKAALPPRADACTAPILRTSTASPLEWARHSSGAAALQSQLDSVPHEGPWGSAKRTQGMMHAQPLGHGIIAESASIRTAGECRASRCNSIIKTSTSYPRTCGTRQFSSINKGSSDISRKANSVDVTGDSHGNAWRSKSHARQQEAARKQLLYLAALVLAMLGLSYASVPLYRMFCQATGFGGTTQRRETVEQKLGSSGTARTEGAEGLDEGTRADELAEAAARRQVTIYFNADVADGLPWRFIPAQKETKVRPGQSTLAFYTAENRSQQPITGVSTYNVSPMKAGIYFNKIQCFCFEEQRLQPGEKIDMPVFFYIDPEFAVDPNMEDITNLTLSYTFFKVES